MDHSHQTTYIKLHTHIGTETKCLAISHVTLWHVFTGHFHSRYSSTALIHSHFVWLSVVFSNVY